MAVYAVHGFERNIMRLLPGLKVETFLIDLRVYLEVRSSNWASRRWMIGEWK